MWLLLCALVTALVVAQRWRLRRFAALHARVGTGLPTLPLLGQMHLFLTTNNKKLMNSVIALARDALNRGGLSSHWLMDRLMLNIADSDLAVTLLRVCNEKGETLRPIKEFYGNCSIFAEVDEWRPRKKLFLSPMMMTKNVNSLLDTFVSNSNVMLEQMQKRWQRNKRSVVSLFDFFNNNSLDNACEATFGVNPNSQLEAHSEISEALEELTKLGGFALFNLWLFYGNLYKISPLYKRFKQYAQIFLEFINKFMQKKQDEWLQEEKLLSKKNCESFDGPLCLMEVMRRAGATDTMLFREETLGLLIAGTDTATVSGSFTALMLAAHSVVQDAVYQELTEIFGASERPVTLADLPRMKYLEAVIKETTRLYPPAPIILRDAHLDIPLPNGITVPKGCSISINIYGINRNPKYWGDDAAEFRPERFLKPLVHPQAYLSFSYGQRSCPGTMYAMNLLKVNLSALLRRYRLLPSPNAPREPQLLYQVTLNAENFDVQLEPRTQTTKRAQ